jgi:UDP-N-acetyl-D-galactosamine dehydrogenase
MAVIGLGYVGLPAALAFAKHFTVIGFDAKEERIEALKRKMDITGETREEDFRDKNITFTSDSDYLKSARFFIVTVPTPITQSKVPNLSALQNACGTIGRALKKGDYVVFESTVYPGCTEDDCVPILESFSGLKSGSDFKTGYSPERINPGDMLHTIANTVKIISGCDTLSLEEIARTYLLIAKAGVYRAASIKVAEAAKITENVQRDLNISLMNELSIIFDKMGILTSDVLEAAGTKWNFAKYYPGLVGGQCISVDPYYLTHKARQLGYNSKVIAAGRFVNDEMPRYVSKKIVQHLLKNTRNLTDARVLILGATFKENVRDVRNSKVADLVHDLLDYSLEVDFVDQNADAAEVKKEYGLTLIHQITGTYDVVIVAVAHDCYKYFSEEYFLTIIRPNGLLADLMGAYRGKFLNIKYWSL